MRARSYQTKAVVLKSRTLGEADRLVTLFTEFQGRLSAVARGARRPKSRTGGSLDVLNFVQVSLSPGRTFDHINECVVVDGFKSLKKNLKSIATGVYLAELIDTFGDERTQNIPLLKLLVEGLTFLDRDITSDVVVRKFEMNLLGICGFTPELENCVSCQEELFPNSYLFDLSQGGVLCVSCEMLATKESQKLSLNAMKMLRLLRKNIRDISLISDLDPPENVGIEIANVLRKYLRFVAERDLRSTKFVDHIESMAR